MLLIVILHQTPFNPSISGLESTIAAGILSPVNIATIIDGIYVLPNPLKTPDTVISTFL